FHVKQEPSSEGRLLALFQFVPGREQRQVGVQPQFHALLGHRLVLHAVGHLVRVQIVGQLLGHLWSPRFAVPIHVGGARSPPRPPKAPVPWVGPFPPSRAVNRTRDGRRGPHGGPSRRAGPRRR